MDKPQIIEHVNKNVNFTLFDAKWIPCSAKVAVLGSHSRGSGAIQIYELCGNDLKLVLESEKGKPMKCGTFGATTLNERNFATGDFDGRLSIWDLERIDDPVYTVKAHSQIVNCIDGVGGLGIGKGAPEIVTGSRDGSVKVWDPRQKDVPVVTIEPEGSRNDCWTVAFGHSHCQAERSISVGYNNGDVKLFDLRVMKARWETTLSHGVCSLEFDRKDIPMNKLVACTLESGIHLFDMRTKHPTKGYAQLTKKAHNSTVWTVRHLPQDRDIFMTTGGSGSLCLWKYTYPDQRSKEDEDGVDEGCMGTLTCLQETTLCQQPLSSMDWSPDKTGLAICTAFDQTIRLLVVTKLNRT